MNADALARAMAAHGFFDHDGGEVTPAARRWIECFVQAFGDLSEADALREVEALRAESCVVPALALERLRSRAVVFFLDAIGQYVDDQAELRGLPLEHDVNVIAQEFGLLESDARWAVRMALTGRAEGPPLELLFPLLGHERIMMRIGAISSRLLHGRGLEPLAQGPGGTPFEPIQPDRQLAPRDPLS